MTPMFGLKPDVANYSYLNVGISALAGASGYLLYGPAGAVLGATTWAITSVARPIFGGLLEKMGVNTLKAHSALCSFTPALATGIVLGAPITHLIGRAVGYTFSATKVLNTLLPASVQAAALPVLKILGLTLVGAVGLVATAALGVKLYDIWHSRRPKSEPLPGEKEADKGLSGV